MSLGYLKTVTAADLFTTQDNSTLALPPDEQISTLSRVASERRVNHQVRLALLQKLKHAGGTLKTETNSSHLTAIHGGMPSHAATLPHMNTHIRGNDQQHWNTINGMAGLDNEFNHMIITKDIKDRHQFSSFSSRGYRTLSQRKHSGRRSMYSDNGANYKRLPASRSEPDLLIAQGSGTIRKMDSKRKSQKYIAGQKPVQSYRSLSGRTSSHRFDQHGKMSAQTHFQEVPGDMNLKKAVFFLTSNNPVILAYSAAYIQHECFTKESAKLEVNRYEGIPRLINLLKIPNANIQQAVCGALRNTVFKNNTNKLEFVRHGGIAEVLHLLQETNDTEIRDQITGLLWNLSSSEDLKESLISTVPILNKCVIIPYVSKSPNSKDYEAFHNATGCLRNLSCAGLEGRNKMRNTPDFIDSIMHYVETCVSTNKVDEKPVEHCVCILHNLSYQLDKEVPEAVNSIVRNGSPQHSKKLSSSASPSCFKPGNDESDNIIMPFIQENDNPKGVEKLLHSKSLKMYTDLMSKSTSDSTVEASAGALLNLTANSEKTSQWMSSELVNKAGGLPQIVKLLSSKNSGMQKTAVSLLSNLSRHKNLQSQLASQALPTLTRLLSSSGSSSTAADSTLSSACNIVRNVVLSNPKMAKPLLQGGLLKSLIAISTSGNSPLAKKTAGNFLSDMWQTKELQSLLKREGFGKKDFLNGLTKTVSEKMISSSLFS
ncbi:plakophilin-1 [Callorhinchus milii]|uniref:plakophilin-1 n=1 Tax=Callorhinchus milii TaxID=7868 RepID=UPI0004572BB5|nr:plakophilin-1 [Callorhinchus milii]|eukprot:gi/632953376/ref/XP_007892384.1/ PREDICTED: plakophilin-1 [Callorhinchus milii]